MRQHPHKLSKLVNSLRQGQTVYSVHALGRQSYVTKYMLLSRPYYTSSGALFIKSRWMLEGDTILGKEFFDDDFSLQDCNVIANRYNDHRLFTSRKSADTYLAMCKSGTVAYTTHDSFGMSDWVNDEPWFESDWGMEY